MQVKSTDLREDIQTKPRTTSRHTLSYQFDGKAMSISSESGLCSQRRGTSFSHTPIIPGLVSDPNHLFQPTLDEGGADKESPPHDTAKPMKHRYSLLDDKNSDNNEPHTDHTRYIGGAV